MKKMLVVVTLLLGGCGFFGGKSKNQYYQLETIPAAPAASPTARTGLPIGIDGIQLPPGFDRNSIVVRGKDHRVEVRGNQLWASPLEEMVIHTLAFDLANRLPQGSVILPGQAKPLGAMRSLYVTFDDLAPGPDNIFILDARWRLDALAGHERITVPMSSLDSANVAKAMSEALGQLAARVLVSTAN